MNRREFIRLSMILMVPVNGHSKADNKVKSNHLLCATDESGCGYTEGYDKKIDDSETAPSGQFFPFSY